MTATIDGETYEGEGYNIEPKKVIGGLFMRSEDRQTALFLPNVEGYSNFVSEQDKPGYFNVSVSPLNDAKGASIYIYVKSVRIKNLGYNTLQNSYQRKGGELLDTGHHLFRIKHDKI